MSTTDFQHDYQSFRVQNCAATVGKMSDEYLDNWSADIVERAQWRGHLPGDFECQAILSAEIQKRFECQLDEYLHGDDPHANVYWLYPHITSPDDIPF